MGPLGAVPCKDSGSFLGASRARLRAQGPPPASQQHQLMSPQPRGPHRTQRTVASRASGGRPPWGRQCLVGRTLRGDAGGVSEERQVGRRAQLPLPQRRPAPSSLEGQPWAGREAWTLPTPRARSFLGTRLLTCAVRLGQKSHEGGPHPQSPWCCGWEATRALTSLFSSVRTLTRWSGPSGRTGRT